MCKDVGLLSCAAGCVRVCVCSLSECVVWSARVCTDVSFLQAQGQDSVLGDNVRLPLCPQGQCSTCEYSSHVSFVAYLSQNEVCRVALFFN